MNLDIFTPSYFRNFLWRGNKYNRKKNPLINLSSICLPRSLGGANLQNFVKRNLALDLN